MRSIIALLLALLPAFASAEISHIVVSAAGGKKRNEHNRAGESRDERLATHVCLLGSVARRFLAYPPGRVRANHRSRGLWSRE